MKNYMNAEQRTEFVTFGVLLGYAQNVFLKKWGEKYLTPNETEKIQIACGLLTDAFECVLNRMDKDYGTVIRRDLDATQILSVPKTKTKITLETYKKKYEEIAIDRTYLDTLIGVSLELCSRCYKTLEEQNNCLLRYTYINTNTSVFTDETKGCPYKIEDVKVHNEFLLDFLRRFFMELESRGNVISIQGLDKEAYKIDSSLDSLKEDDTTIIPKNKDFTESDEEYISPIKRDFEERTASE